MNNNKIAKYTVKAVSAISAWACIGAGIYWIFTNPGSKAGAGYNDTMDGAMESAGWILGSMTFGCIYYASNNLFPNQTDVPTLELSGNTNGMTSACSNSTLPSIDD